jgi:metal-sulfur cluster biosynthetic enzyme
MRINRKEIVMSEQDDSTLNKEESLQVNGENTLDTTGQQFIVSVDEDARDSELEKLILEKLGNVYDPEIGIDIVNLGLIYGIKADTKKHAIIQATLTTPTCPLTDVLESEMASNLEGVVAVFEIKWVWSPVWSLDKITDEGRAQLAALGMNF